MEMPLVEMKGIVKNFGRVQALRGVDFTVGKNEVVGLLGDNGAGKSTLIKILVGFYQPDEGEIYFEGKKVNFSSPKDARAMGIETVYQDLALVELMSIARNFFLGRELTYKVGPFELLDKRNMNRIAKEMLTDIGVKVRDVNETVSFLSGGERQAIAIGRAIHFGAKLLILDEPTAALSIKETQRVLELILEAKSRGLSVVFITHNIYHVYEVADRFTLLEHGKKVGDFTKEEVTPQDIIDIISRETKAA
ncbi:MAG: sugar ABC transporter ATP-binding protein [Synergistetes bacterium]|nr:sugar ABC transporter ATP-binding protein [Synergistota bacterium]